MFEYISLLGLRQHLESSNTLYSNIVSLRCNPFNNFLILLSQLLFQKKIFLYHFYTLTVHVTNTILIFLIIEKSSSLFVNKNKITAPISLIISLVWSLHPVNIESILLVSNAVTGYTYSLLAFYITLSSYLRQTLLNQKTAVILFIIYCIALFTAEFHIMLPLILFFYLTGLAFSTQSKNNSILKTAGFVLKSLLPLIIAGFIFIISFLSSDTRTNFQPVSLDLLFERVFWFSPQVIFHLTKLIIFPQHLSIDQSFLLKIPRTYLDPHVIFCILFILGSLLLSTFSLYKAKKQFPFIFIIVMPYLVSLIPYSHILAPAYNLVSERYLYLPSFILIFGLSHFIFFLISKSTANKATITTIFIVLLVSLFSFSIRSYVRTLDWKDTFSLFESSINSTNNPLYKAFRYRILIPQEKIYEDYPERFVDKKYKQLALENLLQGTEKYKVETELYQDKTPKIIKAYGLDPKTLLAKCGYLLAQTELNLTNNKTTALEIMKKYSSDISLLDIGGLSFYASLLFFNNELDQAETVLKAGYKKFPFSIKIVMPLCDLIYEKYKDLDQIENHLRNLFKYYPYDQHVEHAIAKLYAAKGNIEQYSYFSYVFGIRNHSIGALQSAYKGYLTLNQVKKIKLIQNKIQFLENKSKNQP